MRDIKFRAWDKATRKILEVIEIDFQGMEILVIDHEEQEAREAVHGHYELMQYTGLKDRNGVEIYECDILKWDGGREGISKLPSDYIIEVLKSKHLYIELKEHTNAYMFHYDTSGYNFPVFLEEAKIVGNIYENPELLGDNQ